MQKTIKTCDHCGSDADVYCDLVVPTPPPVKALSNWWPWTPKNFDLCVPCSKELLSWLKK